MKESYNEGVASRIGPEPCIEFATKCKVTGERDERVKSTLGYIVKMAL